MSAPDRNYRLLVFDCHEAWVYQLRVLPHAMDVIVGLQGRHTANWDEAMRPIPANARIVRLADIRCGRKNHQTAKSAGLSGTF
jgi:hypothetical protein